MPKVVKIDPEWFPAENRSLQVGETIDMTDVDTLLKEKKVKLFVEEKKEDPKKPEPKVETKK